MNEKLPTNWECVQLQDHYDSCVNFLTECLKLESKYTFPVGTRNKVKKLREKIINLTREWE